MRSIPLEFAESQLSYDILNVALALSSVIANADFADMCR